jgi:hypothetical protein
MKTVPIKMPPAANAEAWVKRAEETRTPVLQAPKGPTKRLTLDVDAELHKAIKRGCADRGAQMADVVRDLLRREFLPDRKYDGTTNRIS